MGFAPRLARNRLKVSELITPMRHSVSVGLFMLIYLWLGLGGALGTIARYCVNGVVSRYFETFPMGTLLVNVSGSFIIGFFATLTAPGGRWLVSPAVSTFFMAGICGG